jgi:hypothetical protein
VVEVVVVEEVPVLLMMEPVVDLAEDTEEIELTNQLELQELQDKEMLEELLRIQEEVLAAAELERPAATAGPPSLLELQEVMV